MSICPTLGATNPPRDLTSKVNTLGFRCFHVSLPNARPALDETCVFESCGIKTEIHDCVDVQHSNLAKNA